MLNNLIPPQARSWWSVTLITVAALLLAAGCSDDSGGGESAMEAECASSTECDGRLCVQGQCGDCADDAACATDYGAGATCGADGACAPCPAGEEGCACDGGACGDGLVCEADACVACAVGSEGCGCFGNGTCLEGQRCEADVCVSCPAGEEGCACDGGACGDGLVCMEGVCAPDGCSAGIEGCPCREEGDDPRCDEGLTCSDGGMCAPCSTDIAGCPCDEDGACAEDFICNADAECEACPTGSEGCLCDEEGACDDDLVCDEEEEACRPAIACADLGCVENQLCDEAAGVDATCLEMCAEGFVWDGDAGMCEEEVIVPNCEPGAAGSVLAECQAQSRVCVAMEDSAACGECADFFLEEGGACRAAVTCGELTCDADNRDCTPRTETTDAACGGCAMGFEEVDGACQAIPMLNCQPDDPNSILAECQGLNEVCVEAGITASCGPDCLDGFARDPDSMMCVQRLCADLECASLGRSCDGEPLAACGACRAGLTPTDPNDPLSPCREALGCEALNCADGQFCIEEPGQDAVCSLWPCLNDDGEPNFSQAFRADNEACVDCNLACGGAIEGETGRIWPFTLENSNRCICETEPGYFILTEGDFAARSCDADGDGWVRESARSAIDSGDPALEDNARCDVRTVDRVVLENEYQQELTVLLCEEGAVPQIACDCAPGDACATCEMGTCLPAGEGGICGCRAASALDLYETVRNDDQFILNSESAQDLPRYAQGERGRRLRASELNPLTKACVSITGDHNDNNVRDIVEWQGDEPSGDRDVNTFIQFAYFIETHEGRFERELGEEVGWLHIREKSRCDPTFPLGYNPAVDNGDYWRSCTRNRDVAYDDTGENLLIGHDFANWSCEQGALGCPTPPPPTDMTPDGGQIPIHGLCDEGLTLPPVDGVWRGMNHASQFKCVEVIDLAPTPDNRPAEAPHQLTLAELASDVGETPYQMNLCGVACPVGEVQDPMCTSDCDGQECNASAISNVGEVDRPVLTCEATARSGLEVGDVGFVAVRYIAEGLYQRGCVRESSPDPGQELSEPWKLLCPGYATNPRGTVVEHNPGNFGRLICGCGFNYGGLNCEVGCTGTLEEGNVHYGGDTEGPNCTNGYCVAASADEAEGSGRQGFWMCGQLSTMSYDTDGFPALQNIDDGWHMTGEIPLDGVARERMCENDNCAAGFQLR